MTPAAASLGLYFENQRVGWVYDTQALSFEYDSAWLAERTLCVGAIPLLPGRTDAPSVVAFFENLLPEGELRTYFLQPSKPALCLACCRRLRATQPPSYQATSWQALAAELQSKTAVAIHLNGDGVRISLAGAQDKLSVALFADSVPRLGLGTSLPADMARPHWVAMAEQLNLRPQFVLNTGLALAKQLPPALDKAVQAMAPQLAPNDAVMAERLAQYVGKTTKQTVKRMQ